MRLTLFGCPTACSLVSHLALEQTGAVFTYRYVDLFSGHHREPEFLAVNPRGKVPALRIDEDVIVENPAILVWASSTFPDARLLPAAGTAEFAQAISDLSWFASGIHPLISRLGVPGRFIDTPGSSSRVQELATEGLVRDFRMIEDRLADDPLWPTRHCAIGCYLFWLWARSSDLSFDLEPYRRYRRLIDMMLEDKGVRAVLTTERTFRPCFPALRI